MLTLADLAGAFALDGFDAEAAHTTMTPAFRGTPPTKAGAPVPRDASALAYVFEREGRLWLPLTLRREDLREHRGQVSLPGGRPTAGESSFETACRESHEEIGIARDVPVEIGRLAPVYIPVTHTRLTVHVGAGPDPGALSPDPREVAEVRLAALDALLDPANRHRERRRLRGRDVEVPFFELAGFSVWGATAIALAELAERLARAATSA